jgi:imidazolonepropionase-like amidohydrolase
MKGTALIRNLIASVAALSLAACGAEGGAAKTAGSDPAPSGKGPAPGKGYDHDPYPSTYHPYPGVPTLVTGVTIFDGEGGRIDNGAALFRDGKIVEIGQSVAAPEGARVIDGRGKYLTPGVIDIHSHLGDYPSPGVAALSDGNEITSPVTPEVWAEHSVWPQDPGFGRALANGGVTTLQILPGSANLFGGRSVVLKNVYARTTQAMKFPGAPYGLKMACGENPKRVYGGKGRMPSTRMGNIAVDRATWAKAVEYKRRWDKYEKDGGEPPARDLAMDTLRGVLDGEILVQNHCYRADEMANVLDMAHEFGYKVTAFHHAVEAYKIADLLKATNTCAAVWADWYGFKMEAYDAVPENLAILEKEGACAMIHSDDPNGIQRLNQEIAKARASGHRVGIDIPEEVAWKWLAINPAKALHIDQQTGSLRPGKMADVVLWNGNPFSVYTRPEKVWVDGALLYDALDPRIRPVSDFELGQPGEGDVK